MSVLANLNWRYATKKYDMAAKLAPEKLDQILEAIRMAPTSSGYQPFDVMVISNPEIRAKLQKASSNAQVSEASHLLVFAAWTSFSPARVNRFFDLIVEARGARESTEQRRKKMLEAQAAGNAEEFFQSAAQQAFIGLGFALAAAAELQIDSSPMGGFDAKAFDEILGLSEKGLRSVVIMGLGYRAAEGDWLVGLKKVRRPKDEMFHFVK
ncbi:MAG: nitroreductase family protein [Pseudomonadota bacterium]|nr:nitroreductase family protein [Pseudomonadota bacterium]